MRKIIISILLCLLMVTTMFAVFIPMKSNANGISDPYAVLEWQSTDLGEHIHELEINDIDDDGDFEIVTGSSVFATDAGYIYVLDPQQVFPVWQSPPIFGTPATDTAIKAVETIDVDGDGTKEIIFTESHGSLIIYDGVSLIQEWRSSDLGSHMWGLSVNDVNDDGTMEILMGKHYANVLELDGQTHSQLWLSSDLGEYIMGITVDDVDNDGIKEIIVSEIGGYLYIFDGTTHVLEWKSHDLGYAIGASNNILTTDVDGDNQKEIVVGNYEGHVLVFDGLTHDLEWTSPDLGTYVAGLGAYDIDRDGTTEIIAGNKEGYLYVFDGETYEEEWQSPDMGSGIIALDVSNIDDDENIEIVFGTDEGYIYIYDVQPFIIEATIDIDPNTIKLGGEGNFVTCYIEFPEDFEVREIDVNTILLEDTLSPILDPRYGWVTNEESYIMDHDEDGILEMMVKFDRDEVEEILSPGIYNLKVTGKLIDGTMFEGYSDEITVINPP